MCYFFFLTPCNQVVITQLKFKDTHNSSGKSELEPPFSGGASDHSGQYSPVLPEDILQSVWAGSGKREEKLLTVGKPSEGSQQEPAEAAREGGLQHTRNQPDKPQQSSRKVHG